MNEDATEDVMALQRQIQELKVCVLFSEFIILGTFTIIELHLCQTCTGPAFHSDEAS